MRSRLVGAFLPIFLVAAVAGAFILIDDTHDQTVGGTKIHVHPDIGQVSFATLSAATPADGELQYCTDCTENTNPCTGGGSGSLASRTNGAWVCFGSGIVAGATPTPLNFGTNGDIAIFGSPELQSFAGATCPTPQVAQAISASGGLTCVSPAGSSCPAGNANDIQYYDSGSCAGSSQWEFDPTGPQVTLASATTDRSAMSLRDLTNSSGHGVLLEQRISGTSESGDMVHAFRTDTPPANVTSNVNMGVVATSGKFRIIDSSNGNNMSTGTGLFEISRATGSVRADVTAGAGSATVPSFGFINSNSGLAYVTAGGVDEQIWIIAHNNSIAHAQWLVGSSGLFAVDSRLVYTPLVNGAITGAGPVEISADQALLALTTNNGAGTAICINNTNVQDGQVVKVINDGNNDLTFAQTNTATCKQFTTGAATQTLANAGDNIEFIARSGVWYQSGGVQGP